MFHLFEIGRAFRPWCFAISEQTTCELGVECVPLPMCEWVEAAREHLEAVVERCTERLGDAKRPPLKRLE